MKSAKARNRLNWFLLILSQTKIIYIILAKKSRKEKESKGGKKADSEEETIDAIFNAEVVYSDS